MTSPSAAGAEGPDEPLYRILLIEDDDGDAVLVEELLHDTGLRHELSVARTFDAARQRLALTEDPPDCILLDLNLPDLSGIPAVTTVRALVPHTAVVVLTGLAETQAGTQAMSAGAQDYLVKGKVEADTLRRTIRYAVYRAAAERAGAQAQAASLRAQENARLERGLLPQPLLRTTAVSITTRYLPGREQALLGGDFLDAVETDDGLLHAVVGDVAGHGPDAAALGVCLRIAWRTLILGGHRGGEVMRLLDSLLVAERGEEFLFATCVLLTLDLEDRTATLLRAGHYAPLLTEAGSTREVEAAGGIALGIAPGGTWRPTTVPLPAEGTLTLYTDGLTEGHSGPTGNARLGTDGLLALARNLPPADPATQVDLLIKEARALNDGRHNDDVAVLRLDWNTDA
ncbi:SpoIIE family protein phosphatase [Streptomyces sp. NPDC047014]|uniref:PP2C family protein-serine/threonine phosphatase n=1 Tax=Streptomyces sp. NPDC047014 TaxID=3155736 RepID=UPI0033C1B116